MSTTTPRKSRPAFDRTCERCGAVFRTRCHTAKYCYECRPKLQKEYARRSYLRLVESHGEVRRARDRERARVYREENPEKCREAQRRWKQANSDYIREYNRAWRDEHRDHVRALQRESYRRNRAARADIDNARQRLRKGTVQDSDTFLDLAARAGKLMECPRLHIKAMRLPCGDRIECFGNPRCPHCPEDRDPPKMDTSQWGHGGGSLW